MQLPPRWLPIMQLTPTQAITYPLWPQRRPHPAACADPHPHVVQLGNVYYLEDGHHRWARAREAHTDQIIVRVLTPLITPLIGGQLEANLFVIPDCGA